MVFRVTVRRKVFYVMIKVELNTNNFNKKRFGTDNILSSSPDFGDHIFFKFNEA